jgi:hypothetical protein
MPKLKLFIRKRGAALLAACLLAGNAAAQDLARPVAAPSSPPQANKLTFAFYDFSSGKTGVDLNVRHTFQSSTAWIGGYRQSDRFDQVRLGYEYDYHRGWLTLVPSAQAASHGFLGATIYGEAGRPCYGIGGAGRTNLHTYWNLGFDPNDYVQFGGGCRDHSGNSVSVAAIHDNRLDTGQTNTHILVRRYLPGDWRVTIDVVRESGRDGADLVVRAWAVSADVDWRRWFIRVAEDPHVNYTADRQLRVAAGLRF